MCRFQDLMPEGVGIGVSVAVMTLSTSLKQADVQNSLTYLSHNHKSAVTDSCLLRNQVLSSALISLDSSPSMKGSSLHATLR